MSRNDFKEGWHIPYVAYVEDTIRINLQNMLGLKEDKELTFKAMLDICDEIGIPIDSLFSFDQHVLDHYKEKHRKETEEHDESYRHHGRIDHP